MAGPYLTGMRTPAVTVTFTLPQAEMLEAAASHIVSDADDYYGGGDAAVLYRAMDALAAAISRARQTR